MYTSQQSVENKVGGVPGWQNLLMAVGFRLDLPGTGLPAAVFFPTADPGERLQQCSATLQSLLGTTHTHTHTHTYSSNKGLYLYPYMFKHIHTHHIHLPTYVHTVDIASV